MRYFLFFGLFFGAFFCFPVFLRGQLIGDSVSNNFVPADTVSENIHKKPELTTGKPLQTISPVNSPIPANIRDMKLLLPEYWGYDPRNRFRYTPPPFDPTKITLNLSPKHLNKYIDELVEFAGQMNNVLCGEDKMTTIRAMQSVQSHSGIPETARRSETAAKYESETIDYENYIKKQK
jgi:hypothetical protein